MPPWPILKTLSVIFLLFRFRLLSASCLFWVWRSKGAKVADSANLFCRSRRTCADDRRGGFCTATLSQIVSLSEPQELGRGIGLTEDTLKNGIGISHRDKPSYLHQEYLPRTVIKTAMGYIRHDEVRNSKRSSGSCQVRLDPLFTTCQSERSMPSDAQVRKRRLRLEHFLPLQPPRPTTT